MGLRRLKNYLLEREDQEKQWAAGRYHPALELVYHVGRGKARREVRIPLGSGSSDDISVYAETAPKGCAGDVLVYVLAINTRHDYAGLDAYDYLTGDHWGDVFFQEWSCVEHLGKNWEDKSNPWIIKIMREYLPHD